MLQIRLKVLILLYLGFQGLFISVYSQDNTELITSGNPIITHIRCADPSAEVWNDGRVWIYSSHDPDDAVDYSTMADYHVFSSYDLVKWTDHGVILSGEDVSWINSSKKWMFAPDAAYKNGMYYLFFPTMSNEWKWRIGVALSDKPEGPFTDCGHFIEGTDNIDPTCFVDDDGQAYLMWGGGDETPKIARLKDNMTELAEEPRLIDYGFDNFGEGGYMHKKDNIYYFSYTCNTCYPYQSYYSIADNPYGPFEYKGAIKKAPPGAQDHHSIIEFHGQWYYFYHTGNYGADASIYRRNICVDSLFYNPDGTIRELTGSTAGVSLDEIGGTEGWIIPGKFEAEDHFRQSGSIVIQDGVDTMVTDLQDGDWLEYVLDILGTEKYYAELKIRNAVTGTAILLYLDDILYDTLSIETSAGILSDSIFMYKGKHTLRLLFSHTDPVLNLADVDYIELRGEKEYCMIDAKAGEGGNISPSGKNYYLKGESAIYTVSEEKNYDLISLLVDSEDQGKLLTYTFEELASDHSIEAQFIKCDIIGYSPYYRVNDQETQSGSSVIVTERDSLLLGIDVEENCAFFWSGPHGFTSNYATILIDSITMNHAGGYTATIINSTGCTYEQTFNVKVNFADLDVYRAEECLWQSGTRYFGCNDLGGGYFMGMIDDADWCYFNVNIPHSGYYNLISRVATANAGGSIEISAHDSIVAAIPVEGSKSGGWENWYTTIPVEAGLQEGSQTFKFTFRGDGDSLFNFNWWDMEFVRNFPRDSSATVLSTGNDIQGLRITSSYVEYSIDNISEVEIRIYSITGRLVSTPLVSEKQTPGTYAVRWNNNNSNSLSAGIYLVYFRKDNFFDVQKVVLN